ncbi:MAG: cold shock and DUF1294 domain-containing protein [Ottowia sp.]|uniref:DUF1294 domain-containing protein n=1 Tax=Ottowia sp. TaxID=1898956 RepID=UPI003C77C2AF
MRFEGVIKSWNDDRGFGFIEPTQGGQEIFVHVKAFRDPRERPQVAQRVTFEVEMGPQGKKRASNVELLRARSRAPLRARKDRPAQWGTASLFAIPVFLVVLALGYALGHPPRWALWAYLGLSVITFVTYAADKSAAKRGAWRISEQTLHLMALLGGWPGALVAQQALRHKSSKMEFRTVFWGTVILNMAVFLFLASSYGQELLANR